MASFARISSGLRILRAGEAAADFLPQRTRVREDKKSADNKAPALGILFSG